jgi:hypothetical protein
MTTTAGVICEKDKVGLSIVEVGEVVAVLLEDDVRPPASHGERPRQLLYMYDEMVSLLESHKPDLVFVKHAVAGRFAADPQRYELGGIVQLACARQKVLCDLLTTDQVRKAMGAVKETGAYDRLLEAPDVMARSNKARREQYLFAIAAARTLTGVR